jgi:hypothetical protein
MDGVSAGSGRRTDKPIYNARHVEYPRSGAINMNIEQNDFLKALFSTS